MAKVRLLNDGGYGDMDDVEFPVEVDVDEIIGNLVYVTDTEISRVGGINFGKGKTFSWFIGTECELVEVSK